MSDTNAGNPGSTNGKAIALPKTVADLLDQRKGNRARTLNDDVEAIHLSLWEVPEYQRLLDAVTSEDAVEGSLTIDDAKAAEMIRTEAAKKGNRLVASKKLGTIVQALHVVMRRYGISRKERRYGFSTSVAG
jgi:transcriptional regulator of acetoin/glycerol metabolism